MKYALTAGEQLPFFDENNAFFFFFGLPHGTAGISGKFDLAQTIGMASAIRATSETRR
jgi:hypothetical protein